MNSLTLYSNPSKTISSLKAALEKAKQLEKASSSSTSNEVAGVIADCTINDKDTHVSLNKDDSREASSRSNESISSSASIIIENTTSRNDTNICREPSKDSNSLFPTMKWYQNKEKVFVTFLIGNVGDYELKLQKDYFSFCSVVSSGSK